MVVGLCVDEDNVFYRFHIHGSHIFHFHTSSVVIFTEHVGLDLKVRFNVLRRLRIPCYLLCSSPCASAVVTSRAVLV
jgi:hypothetical protein